jgi:ABC-type lipoprotein release transport system permease subunit
MNQALLFGLIGALVGGGLGVLIAIAPDEGEIFYRQRSADHSRPGTRKIAG